VNGSIASSARRTALPRAIVTMPLSAIDLDVQALDRVRVDQLGRHF
jgi:hypothetical protein